MLKRLLDRQLKMLDASDARLAQYLADPPQNISAPEKAPELLGADVVIIGLLVGIPLIIVRRRQKAQSKPQA